jgi:hypothetical protein
MPIPSSDFLLGAMPLVKPISRQTELPHIGLTSGLAQHCLPLRGLEMRRLFWPAAMSINSTTVRKLFSYAYCVAVGSFVFGLFLVRTIEHFDIRYVTGIVLCGTFLICVLFSTRRDVRRFATSEKVEKLADQFLWSCIFFSMLSFGFSIAVTAAILYSADFTRTFGAVCFGALTCVGIYPVLRDAKRLADAVGPSAAHDRENGR